MKHGTINRSSSRTAKISRSGRGTYVKPPRMRQSVFVVRQALRGLAAFAAFQLSAPAALAGATIEGTVTSGKLNSITQPTPNTTNLNQGSKTLSMDLTVLDVPKGDTLNINQQAKDWLFVGRGVGNDPFRIYGTVNATGQVFLVNPQGVIFAPGSSVNVGGLVATTNDVRMEDGKYVFQNNGGTGTVVNQGRIYAPSGYAALIGPKVSNEGTIIARTVALAAGNRVALDMIGDGLISVRVEQAAVGAAALNSGTIIAEGGSVYLAARSADALLDTVVNNTGIIRANSLVERNGSIILDGGSHGVVANSGTLDVSGKEAGATGGTVKVLGEYVGLFNGSRIDASGDAGGGTVLVGGNFHGFGPEQNAKETYVASDTVINADAINSGNGGQVAIWSNNGSEFYGSVSARGGAQFGDGGFVEISGKDSLVFAGNVDTSAPNGRGGNLLLDPSDIFIIDGTATTGDLDATLAGSGNSTIVFTDGNVGGNTVTVGQLQAQGNTSITLEATNTIRVGTADGLTAANVDLSATLTTNTNTLTLSAGNGTGGAGNVTFNTGSVITTGGGSVAINAGQTGDTTGNAVLGAITTNGGHITVTAQGSVSLVDAQNAGAGNVVITTNTGNITGAGVVTGNNVTLDSATGVGVSTADRVNTAANTLAARSRVSGGVFLAQAHAATLASIGAVTNTAAAGAPYNLTSGGLITIGAGGVNTGGTGATTLTTTAGGIALGANDVGNTGSATTLVSAANITGTTGVVHGTDVTLDSATGVGTDTDNRLKTAADTLAARSTTSGGVFISEADDVSLAQIGGVANSTAAGGAYHLSTSGDITVNTGGVTTANGQIQLVGASITNNDTISNSGGASNVLLRADAFDLNGTGDTGQVQGGSGAVIVTPNTVTNSLGIVSAGDTTVSQSDLDAIHTTNFVVLGSAVQGFTGHTLIGETAQVDGGTKSLAFFRAAGPANTTTIGLHGVTTAGDVIVNAGPGNIVSHGGTVKGNHVQLRATTGIGTLADRVLTDADTLAINNIANGAFVTEANNVSLNDVNLTVGGNINNFANSGGNGGYNFIANGAISIDGNITTNNGVINLTGDSITNHAAISNGGAGSTSNIILAADALSLGNLGASINSNGGATVLRPRTAGNSFGIEDISADTHVNNADIASISTTNFIIFGGGSAAPGAFTGNMTIGVDNLVNGGAKSLAFLRDPTTAGKTTTIGANGVTTTGDVTIGAGASSIVSLGGTISGNHVALRAGEGIGTSGARVHTSATTLAVQNAGNGGSGAFVAETNDVTLADVTLNVGGTTNATTNTGGTGAYDVTAAGTISVGTGGVNANGTGTTTLTTTGVGSNISLGDVLGIGNNGVGNTSAATTLVSAGNIAGIANTVRGTSVTLDSATGVGTNGLSGRVNTVATTLAARSTVSGGVFITDLGAGLSLNTINGVANGAAGIGAYQVNAIAPVTIDGAITAGSDGLAVNAVGSLTNNAGVSTTNGSITLSGSSFTNNSTVSNGGGANTANILVRADQINLVGTGGTIQGGAGAVILTPQTNTNSLAIESPGGVATTTLTNADLATITTTNFVVIGSANQGFTGSTTIGETAQVDGGTKSLAFFRAAGPANTTTIGAQGVKTAGDVIVSAGPGNIISHGGTVKGNQVQLRATTGIGTSTPTGRVLTDASVLAVNNIVNGAFVTEANNVSLNNVNLTVGGNINNFANSGGPSTLDIAAGGTMTVDGTVSTTTGSILLTAASLTNNSTISNNGTSPTANIVLSANAFDLNNVGTSVNAGAAAVVLRPRTVTNSFGIESPGDTTLTNGDIANLNGAGIIFGSPLPGNFTGNINIGQTNQVLGGAKNLAFLRDPGALNAGTITIGLNGLITTGNVAIGAGGHGSIVSQGGTIAGNQVALSATEGIGTSLVHVLTSANTLAVSNAGNNGSGAFVTEANGVSLANVNLTAGGVALNTSNTGGTGAYDVTAGNTITVGTGGINTTGTGSTRLATTAGDISIGGNNVGNLAGATTLVSANNITGTTGVVNGTAVTLSAAGDIGGGEPNPLHVDAGTLNFNSPGAVTISEGNDTVLTGTNTAGSLTLLSAGSITDAPATSVNVAGDAIFFGPSITLADNGGDALTVGGQALFNSGPISVGLGGAANFGTLRFTSTGGLVSIHESSDTVLDGGNNAETLVLSSTGSITNANGVSLRVAGNANLSGTSIDLGNAPVDFVHLTSLTFNSPGAVHISADEGTVLSGTSTAGSLNLIAGTITNAPGTSVTVATTANFTGTQITLANHADDVLSVGTDASFRATTSSLSIGEGGTANFGTLNFNSFLGASIHESSDTVLTGANAAPSLVLSSTGSLTDAPNTSLNVVGNASLSGASITLGDNAGDTTNFGTLTFNSTGAVSIHEGSDTVLSGTSTADSLILSSAGSITNEAGISLGVTNNANFSGTSITLGTSLGDGIDFGTLTFNSPGAVSIREASATVLSGASTADSLTLIATPLGSITNAPAASLNVTQNANLSADSITLGNHPGDSINFGSLTFNSAGAVSISEASAMQITGTNTADSLALSSTGAITDAAGAHLTVTHNASFTGTSITLADSAADRLEVGDNASFNATVGGITIGDAGFVNFGSLTFNSPGAVTIQEDCCTLIAGINHAGSLNLTSSQGITNTDFAQITVDGNASFTGTSIILANNATNLLSVGGTASFTATTGEITVGTLNVANFGFLNFKAPGTVSISEGSDTAITGNNTAGSLVLSSAGAITEVGTSLDVTGNASFSGASINLGNNAGDTVNFGSLTFNSAGDVSISEDSATVLNGASTAGSLTLKSLGSVTQAAEATLMVGGLGSIDAGANPITLTNMGNDFVGTVTLKGTVTKVTDTNGISVMLDTSGDTVIIANGNLTSTGDLSLKGTTSGNLIGISNGGVLEWGAGGTPLTVGSNGSPKAALLIAAQPNKTITGPGSTGNALDATTTYSKLANATGGTVNVPNGEFVLIADSLPRHPSSPDLPTITANTAVLKILGLTPGNRVTIQLNGQLRLLADKGVFRFTGTSVLPQGATSLDPKKVQLFIGNASITSAADELAARSAISAAQQSALNSASSDARQSFGTDSVTQQIDMGFAGDVGIAPTMAHNVPLQGEIISTPEGVTESKGGQ